MAVIGLETFFEATLWCLLIPIFHLALIWWGGGKDRHIRWMFFSFAIAGTAMAYEMNGMTGAEWGVAISTFGFWALGYMEAFSMLCRGFSLTILCDLKEKQPLSSSDLVRQYGGGKGAHWLLEKRLGGLLSLKLIKGANQELLLSKGKAWTVAEVTAFYKRILKLGKGG